MDGPIYPNLNWSEVGLKGEKQTWREITQIVNTKVLPKGDPFDSVSCGNLRLSGLQLIVRLVPDNTPGRTIYDEPVQDILNLAVNCEEGVIVIDESKWGEQYKVLRLLTIFRGDTSTRLARRPSWFQKGQDFFFMPLLTFNDFDRVYGEEWAEISSICGLILEPTRRAEVGQSNFSEYDAAVLFCELGNKKPEELPFKSLARQKTTLNKFIPP